MTTKRTWLWTSAIALVAIDLACTRSLGRRDAPPSAASSQSLGRVQTLNHLMPARDSAGGAPSRFEWTPVEGADRYAIGVWNEVDVLIWKDTNVHGNSVARPADLLLEPGTYLWSVTALRDDQPLVESGLAAFMVQR